MKKNKLHSGQCFSIWSWVYLRSNDLYPLCDNKQNRYINLPKTRTYTQNKFLVIGYDNQEGLYHLRGETRYEERGAWQDHLSYTEPIYFKAFWYDMMLCKEQPFDIEIIIYALKYLRVNLELKNSRKRKGLEIANKLFNNQITFQQFEELANNREIILPIFIMNTEFINKIGKIWKQNKGTDLIL